MATRKYATWVNGTLNPFHSLSPAWRDNLRPGKWYSRGRKFRKLLLPALTCSLLLLRPLLPKYCSYGLSNVGNSCRQFLSFSLIVYVNKIWLASVGKKPLTFNSARKIILVWMAYSMTQIFFNFAVFRHAHRRIFSFIHIPF